MKLTDLNIDCIEGILEHLEIDDLMSAADSNTRLRHAARFVYDRKYSEKTVSLLPGWNFESGSGPTRPEYIFYNVRSSFRLLRCFGHLVSGVLHLESAPDDYNENNENYCNLIGYIQEYCSATLNKFYFTFDNQFEFFTLKKPFAKVTELRFNVKDQINANLCALGDFDAINITKDCLVRLFPAVQILEISAECSQFVHSGCIANHFQQLEHLEITHCGSDWSSTCAEVYIDIIRKNPQLKKLNLYQKIMDMNMFQALSENLQNLEYLEVNWFDIFISNFNGKLLHLNNLKHLSLRGPWPDNFVNPISFVQLETMDIWMEDKPIEYFDGLFPKIQSIETLILRMCTPDAVNSLIENHGIITKNFPFLVEFEVLAFCPISISKVQRVMTIFKQLTVFEFGFSEDSEYTYLQKCLSTDWSLKYTKSRYIYSLDWLPVMLKRKNIKKLPLQDFRRFFN
ncbi:uncharacterized protein LOC129578686 [Sitodiplosis mosellana]|uniref:uncharacterized protein LOC129578686 n=1 Tax=Sitodiplosis mosellana TaxID=263140 RepID=UPI00244487FB|nr:uncharacterized protein LOC129578686 [Sitodiplosis mosellana]